MKYDFREIEPHVYSLEFMPFSVHKTFIWVNDSRTFYLHADIEEFCNTVIPHWRKEVRFIDDGGGFKSSHRLIHFKTDGDMAAFMLYLRSR